MKPEEGATVIKKDHGYLTARTVSAAAYQIHHLFTFHSFIYLQDIPLPLVVGTFGHLLRAKVGEGKRCLGKQQP